MSVVVPTFGRPEQIWRSLASLMECDVPRGGREILIVDDGSPLPVEESLAPLPPDVRIIRQANAGPAAARNAGIAAAGSELIAVTDDDTTPARDWLVELVDAMDADPRLGAVGGRIIPMRRGFVADFVQLERYVDHGRTDDGQIRYLVTANAIYRRAALDEVGGFDTSFREASGEDVDLSLRLLEAGWPLGLADRAVVEHDHRTSLRGLVRSTIRHSRVRCELLVRHPSLAQARSSGSIGSHLSERFARSRRMGIGRVQSIIYVAMHLVKSAVMVLTVADERRRRRARAIQSRRREP